MAIDKFTKDNLTQLRKDFADAVKDLEAQYGIKFSLHNISFSPEAFRTKLSAELVGADPEYIRNWNAGYHRKFGLTADYIGKEISVKARDGVYNLRIVGCEKTGKHPIKAQIESYNGSKKDVKTGDIVGISSDVVLKRGENLANTLGILG